MTKKHEKKSKSSAPKVISIVAASVLVLSIAITFALSNIIYSFALTTDSTFSKNNVINVMKERKPEAFKKAGASGDDGSKFSGTKQEENSWLKLNSQDAYITSHDDLKLHALTVDNPESNHKYAIICHGYTSRAEHMSNYAEHFYHMGFSLLIPDARAHGESEGNIIGMGYLEKNDILLWIDEIIKNDENAEIVLFGVSMGAAIVLMTSGEEALPQQVKAVISDCAYTSVYDEIGYQLNKIAKVPPFPLTDTVSLVAQVKGAYSFKDASCVEAVKNSVTPTLFIHGNADTFVPFDMLDTLYNSANCPKEKLIIENGPHAKSAVTDPELYWSTVESYLEKYI